MNVRNFEIYSRANITTIILISFVFLEDSIHYLQYLRKVLDQQILQHN